MYYKHLYKNELQPPMALRLLIAVAAATGPSAASAQTPTPTTQPPSALVLDDESDLELLDLDVPVVVTAARHEQSYSTIPYAISVITAEDIRRAGATSVTDALRLVPGLDVADLSFTNAAVSPRGFHGLLARQMLVLVDGRQLFDSFFGGTLWGSWPFQVQDIERIEVIRSPGVTWGANAVNGVINIITRDPEDQAGLTFETLAGSRGYHQTYLGYGFADEKLRLRVSGSYDASNGFHRGGNWLLNLNDYHKRGRVSLFAIYDHTPDDRFTFSLGSAIMDGGFPQSPMGGLRGAPARSQANYFLARWHHHVEPGNRTDVTFYVNDFSILPAIRSADWRYQQLALQFAHTFHPADDHTVVWGIDTRADLVDATNADPSMLADEYVTTGIVGAYIQDDWRFAPKWLVSLGGRIDYDTYGGVQPSGRAALAWMPTDTQTFFAAVSRAFQMPPGALRFMRTPFAYGLVLARSDRQIDPQRLVSWEAGYHARFLDNTLELNVNTFLNYYRDLTTISPRLGVGAPIIMYEDNRAEARHYGVELDARYRPTRKLTLLGHYTYQQLDWRSSAPVHDKDMMTPPRHKFMVGVRYSPCKRWHFSSHLYWVDDVEAPNPWNPFGARAIDAYFRLDLLAEHEFLNGKGSIAVGVRNLLDNHHPEGGTLFLNDAEVPRMIFAQLKLRIH